MGPLKFQFLPLEEGINVPSKATPGSVGYDVESSVTMVVPAGKTVSVPTGFMMKPPSKMFARVTSRSTLVRFYNLCVIAEVVNPDYRGEYHVILSNLSQQDVVVRKGDRIAQMVFQRFASPKAEVVDGFEDGGIDSTGIRNFNYLSDDPPPPFTRRAKYDANGKLLSIYVDDEDMPTSDKGDCGSTATLSLPELIERSDGLSDEENGVCSASVPPLEEVD